MTIIEELYTLKHVNRWNGVCNKGIDTTALHSYFVTCISGFLADIYNETSTIPINKEQVLMHALYHDVAEIHLTHITYGAKKESNILEEEVSNLKKKKFFEWCKRINRMDLINDIENYKSIKDIIDFADIVDACMYCKEEVDNGNKFMQEIYKRQKETLMKSIEKYIWAKRFYFDYLLDIL